MTYKVAIIGYHPVPYQVPIYRAMEKHPRLDSTVIFLSRTGVDPSYDATMRATIRWDIDLLGGYSYKFLKNWGNDTYRNAVIAHCNPAILGTVLSGQYQAVILPSYVSSTALMAIAAAKLRGVKVIMRAEADLINKPHGLRTVIKNLLLPTVLRLTDAVMYSCKRNHDYFRHYKVPEKKLFFIPCAVDNTYCLETERRLTGQKAEIRKSLGIPEDAFVMLSGARLHIRKRPRDLLDAFIAIAGDFPRAVLVYAGDGPDRAALEQEAEARMPGRVKFTGFQNTSAMMELIYMSDIGVLASEYDPSPKFLSEDFVFGKPVIASDHIGTAIDLVQHEKNGLIYPCGDIPALSAAMRRMMTDSAMLTAMQEDARKTADRWSPEADAAGIVEALDACIGEKRSNSAPLAHTITR